MAERKTHHEKSKSDDVVSKAKEVASSIGQAAMDVVSNVGDALHTAEPKTKTTTRTRKTEHKAGEKAQAASKTEHKTRQKAKKASS
jgi:hypothetical protein